MKSTGIVRRMDELGRIVLPSEIRKHMHLTQKDPLEIYVNGDSIVLKKYSPACIFCGDANGIIVYRGRNVCSSCIKVLKRKVD